MRFRRPPFTTLTFIVIASALMVLLDWVVFRDEPVRQLETIRKMALEEEVLQSHMPEVEETFAEPSTPDRAEENVQEPVPEEPEPEVVMPAPERRPKIAVIIDDVGMDVRRSRQVMDLPPGVTLAFLPYAGKTRELARQAKAQGHELMIHVPMEAVNGDVDLGGMALRSDMEAGEISAEMERIFGSFEHYSGINNHMGSRLTQDEAVMAQLMDILNTRNLYFIDSRTIHNSVAAAAAQDRGVPHAVRDVFLDHEETEDFVTRALADTERIAQEYGQAIAIGHPKDVTIAGLKAWIPTLEEKGIDLVPASALVRVSGESGL